MRTNAVLPLLSDSFGSNPRFNNRCNNKSSFLSVAKHKLRGKSILPWASIFSVSNKTPSMIGSFCSFKCCSSNKEEFNLLHVTLSFGLRVCLLSQGVTETKLVLPTYARKLGFLQKAREEMVGYM